MITREQLTGATHSHLESVVLNQKSHFIHPQVKDCLIGLIHAAHEAGFELEIASGFRDFQRQRAIWNAKFSGSAPILDHFAQPIDKHSLKDDEKMWAILRWSALPGASRHHWGCDFDLFALNLLPEATTLKLEPWEYLSGHQFPFYQWLREHLSEYGFFFPYDKDRGGVAAEPWHVSHISTADDFLQSLTTETLRQQLELHPIDGQAHVLANLDLIYNQFIANICSLESVCKSS